ncbi:uncharacterized protein LOC106060639 isoform X1 [Biomphalaria glabrata]|uniref:Uncharacterized protein LOC106060639 isoform X1 n=1 Tax=Biomphalaria glabrata TaxID=6526 RepID=A0A9W2ZJ57_BIOGL|nr:uncharacterized protein LOC106060639 isoform X1 [Biomphalaria glabrata]
MDNEQFDPGNNEFEPNDQLFWDNESLTDTQLLGLHHFEATSNSHFLRTHEPAAGETERNSTLIDSGRSSMVTPATTWESPQEFQRFDNTEFFVVQHDTNPGSSSVAQIIPNAGKRASPASLSLKRSSMESQQNEKKRWKVNDGVTSHEDQPRVVVAESKKQEAASKFPTADKIPSYASRLAPLRITPPNESRTDGTNYFGGGGHKAANGVFPSLLGRSQPVDQQQVQVKYSLASLQENIDLSNIMPLSQILLPLSQKMDSVNRYAPEVNNNTEVPSSQDMRWKCSAQTSKSLQDVVSKRYTDNKLSQECSTPIQIPGRTGDGNGAVTTERSAEEERKKRQQEKNRQYAKESRDRKNEKLRTLEQKTKEQDAQIEIMKKVVTHYYVRLHKTEPQWIEDLREWVSNQGGNSQTRLNVRTLLPNDADMLKELGNSPYGSVLSPTKLKSPPGDVVDVSSGSPSPASRAQGDSIQDAMLSPVIGQAVRLPVKSLFKSNSDIGIACEAESNVDMVQDMNAAHRHEAPFSVGLFSGHRTDVKILKPENQLEKKFLSPWSTSFPDQRSNVAAVEEVGTVMEDDGVLNEITIPCYSQEAFMESVNLSSFDFLQLTAELAQTDQQEHFKI